jgi:hypothetical protein
MKKRETALKLSSLLVISLILTSCSGTAARKSGDGLNTIPQGRAVVVGKIVIEPAPENDVVSGMAGKTIIFLDDVMRPAIYRNNRVLANWPDNMTLSAYVGEDFLIETGQKKFFAVAGGYFFGRSGGVELMQIPLSFVVDIEPSDKAVYIGTLKITRDVFYKWKDVEVVDEYNKAAAIFYSVYGKKYRLRKALARVK